MQQLFENWRKYLIKEEINVNASKKSTQRFFLALNVFVEKNPNGELPDRGAIFKFGGKQSVFPKPVDGYKLYGFKRKDLFGLPEDLPVTSMELVIRKDKRGQLKNKKFLVGGEYEPMHGFYHGGRSGDKKIFQKAGEGGVQVEILYNPNLLKTRNDLRLGFNELLPMLRKTFSHELFHAYQAKKGGVGHKSKEGEFWAEVPIEEMPDVPSLVRYYLSDHETEAFSRGFYRQSIITKVPWEDIVNAYLDDIEEILDDEKVLGNKKTELQSFRTKYRALILKKWKNYAAGQLPCATLSNKKVINPSGCPDKNAGKNIKKISSTLISKSWGGAKNLLNKMKNFSKKGK